MWYIVIIVIPSSDQGKVFYLKLKKRMQVLDTTIIEKRQLFVIQDLANNAFEKSLSDWEKMLAKGLQMTWWI